MNKEKNPWTIHGQREIYDNPWIRVTEYDVTNPGGGKGIYGKVHFKHLAVGVIPIDEQWNTWLVGQYRFTLNEYSWEIPEGGGRMDEDPLEAGKRELLEETGLVAEDWTRISTQHLSNSVSDELGYIFLARKLSQFSPEPEETEQIMVRKIPFSEAVGMIETGQITDSLSVTAIQKVQIMLMQGKLKK